MKKKIKMFIDGHHYLNESSKSGLNRLNMSKIMVQMLALQTSLPLSSSSSAFVVTSTQNIKLWKIMIVGSENTPYEHGCFEFDMVLPEDYPKHSPKMQFLTTGNGSVRFNPNLYENGKVCLSLLGTWQGSQSENWNPKESTLLQLIVSLQALVFVEEPYYNEPGYESSIDNATTVGQSTSYNIAVRKNNTKWAILNQIQRAKAYNTVFAPAILTHFRLKQKEVLKTLYRWKRDEKMYIESQHVFSQYGGMVVGESYDELIKKIKKELSEL